MSLASDGIPNDQRPRSGGALAVLAATAIGGVIASRLGRKPLILAAGTAVLALLRGKSKKTLLLRQKSEDLPSGSQEHQVQKWLSQQMIRDEQVSAPSLASLTSADEAVPLEDYRQDTGTTGVRHESPLEEISVQEENDDYYPESLLFDDPDENERFNKPSVSFASLTEPVSIFPLPTKGGDTVSDNLCPVHPTGVLDHPATPPEPCVLGIEPLPSWSETIPAPTFGNKLFSSEPVQAADPVPDNIFTGKVFEGGTVPDEIDVAPNATPIADENNDLFDLPSNPPPEALDIPVQLVAPGEASFDPPLPKGHPWMSAASIPPALEVSQPKTFSPPAGPVIEGEIVLRPHAPIDDSATCSSQRVSSSVAGNESGTALASKSPEPPFQGNETPQEAPVHPLGSKRPRSRWRSLWQDG